MKYQLAFVTCVGLLFCGCQGEDAVSEETQTWISTDENPQERSSEQEEKIQGTWSLLSSTCPNEDSPSSEKWRFDKGELTWNAYRHPYCFKHDTLFIAGLAHSISWSGDVLVLDVLEMNCQKKLKRQ